MNGEEKRSALAAHAYLMGPAEGVMIKQWTSIGGRGATRLDSHPHYATR